MFAPRDTWRCLEGCLAVTAESGSALGTQGRCSAPAGHRTAPRPPAASSVLASNIDSAEG